jgi:glycerol-3-phosphate acyltransferase PlsY
MYTLIFILLAYLVGSIPFSYLLTKWRTGLNIRNVGEGNVGSRNVWHVVGPVWGILAFALDTLKGLAVFVAGGMLGISLVGTILAGVAAILGHQFSIFLRGQGGKGLATIFGFMVGLAPLSTLGGIALMGLAYLFFHDFNPSVIIGALGVIFLPLFLPALPFSQRLVVALCALSMALLAGVKKLLDRQHEAVVWASHPWESQAKPGFFHEKEEGEQVTAPESGPQP